MKTGIYFLSYLRSILTMRNVSDKIWRENKDKHFMWYGRKVMRLATLCTNRQCCCLSLHMAISLTPCRRLSTSFNLLQWLRYCWERLKWSCVCEVRYENGQAKVWAMLCHQILCKSWRIRYCDLWNVTKGLWRTFPSQGTSVQMAQVLFRRPRTSGRRTS